MGALDDLFTETEQPKKGGLDDLLRETTVDPNERNVGPFDPEGPGYDYDSAQSAGLKPDETGHWPSRNPQTGQLLKGKKHSTWNLLEQGEREAGMEIYQGADGKYYSRPQEVAQGLDSLLAETGQEPEQPGFFDRFRQAFTAGADPRPVLEEQNRQNRRELLKQAAQVDSQALAGKVQSGQQLSPVEQRAFQEQSGQAIPTRELENLAIMGAGIAAPIATVGPQALGVVGRAALGEGVLGAGMNVGFDTADALGRGELPDPKQTAINAAFGFGAGALGAAIGGMFSTKIKDVARFKGVSPQQVNKELLQTSKATGVTRGEALDDIIYQSAQTPEGARAFAKYMDEAAATKAPQTEKAIPDFPMGKGDIYEHSIDEDLINTLTQKATPILKMQPEKSQERIFQQISDLIDNQELELTQIRPLLDKAGVDYKQFAQLYKASISRSGRILNYHSRTARELNKVFQGTEAEELFSQIATQAKNESNAVLDALSSVYRITDNVRRASIVTQLSTASRNIQTQIGRGGVEVFDTFLQGMLNRNPKAAISEAGTELMVLLRRMSKPQQEAYMKALDDYPIQEGRLMNTPVHEIAALDKYTKSINFFNRWQELHSRRIGYQMRLARNLKRMGYDPFRSNLAEVPQDRMEKAIEDSVDFALDMSFANRPKNQLSKAVLDMYRAAPVLTQINPFPKFNFANAWQFMFDFTPAGFMRLVNKSTRDKIASGNMEALSRPMIGTALTAMGMAIRTSEFAGPKWYELQVGDTTIDTRPLAPFNIYMFLGELIANPQNLTLQDYLLLPIGLTRVTGTGLVLVDLLRDRPRTEYNWKLLKDYVGAYLGGFSVPARTAQDFIGGIQQKLGMTPEETFYRDTEQRPVLGPFMSNIPGLSRQLPPVYSPFKEGPLGAENPILKQLTGINVKTRSRVEHETKENQVLYQSIYPRTGIPEADNEIQKYMAIAMKDMTDPTKEKMYINNREVDYELLPPSGKRIILRAYLKEARARAMNMLELNDPELFRQVKEKRQDKDEVQLEKDIAEGLIQYE